MMLPFHSCLVTVASKGPGQVISGGTVWYFAEDILKVKTHSVHMKSPFSVPQENQATLVKKDA